MVIRIIIVCLLILVSAFALAFPRTKFAQTNGKKIDQRTPIKNSFIGAPKPKNTYKEAPEISARSSIIIDEKTGISLYEKNPHLKHLPASTTKMMTALIALENCLPQDIITVGQVQKDGTQMGLEGGDQISVESLLNGLLIASGNDAAYALASGCSEDLNEFVNKMNQKAQDLDMKNTNFVNPAGFDNDLQFSTAADLAKLAKVVVANPLIAKIVATKSTIVTDITGNRVYFLENVNKLLGEVNGVEGVKTGQTEGSLEILITKTNREGNTIITAVLGSQDRVEESKILIEWAYENFIWE